MKKITIALAILALLTIGIYLFARFALKSPGNQPAQVAEKPGETVLDLRPKLISRLQYLVNKGSNGLFNLHISEVEPDILASEISLKKVLLEPDSAKLAAMSPEEKSTSNIFKFQSDSIHITGIGIKDVFSANTIDLKKVFIHNPVITILQKSPDRQPDDSLSTYQSLLGQLKRFSAKEITISNGTVINQTKNKTTGTSFKNFYADLSDLLIDSSTQKDRTRFLYAKKATLSLNDYSWGSKDGFYSYSVDKISVTTADNTIRVSNIHLLPRYSKEKFAKKAGSATERYELRLSSLLLRNVNWWDLANNESIIADQAILDGGNLDIYLDRSLPQKTSRVGNYPHQLLMKAPMKINIRKLNISNVHFDYAEFNPHSGKKGGLSISNMNGSITNLTNMPGVIQSHPLTKVIATGSLLGVSNATLSLQLNMLEYKNGSFKAGLDVTGFEGKLINPLAEPIGMFSVSKGKLKGLQSYITGNNNHGTGNVVFQYEDLKVAALEKDGGRASGLDKKDVTSLVANMFLVKKQNPASNEEPKKTSCSFERDPYSSFFNLIWKTTFVGILKTTGLPEKLAYKK